MNKDNNMKRAFFLTVIVLTLISCGESSKAPINLPEYKIVNTEIPRVSSNGYISPTQNLVYSIEIAHPLQKDSLELIQDYFIKKGEEDFPGVNKIIVRAYLNGTSSYGVPYASLIIIGAKKDIEINQSAEKLVPIKDKQTPASRQEYKDPLVGKFYCERSHDWYVFNSDNSGQFIMQGVPPTKISWKRKGKNVTIISEMGTNTNLKFDEKNGVLEESSQEASEIYGTTLIYQKM